MYVILWCDGPYASSGVFMGSYDSKEVAIAQADALAESGHGYGEKFTVYEAPHNYAGGIEGFEISPIHSVMKKD